MALLSAALLAFLCAQATALPPSPQNVSVASKNFKFFGTNIAGPEFGEKTIPGVKGKEYIWPTLSTIDTFLAKGFNTFRISILAERVVTTKAMDSPISEPYMDDLKKTVEYITSRGGYAMINPHNYGRWYGELRKDHAAWETYWKRLATPFAKNKKVIFDTDNEFHDSPQELVVKQNQAAINGIRAAGAKTQFIHVEGNSWTGAWHWAKSENAKTMLALKDPADKSGAKIVYHMHQYLDSDGSGTNPACVSATIGSERLQTATQWLKENKKVGFLGEFAGGDNAMCKAAVEDMLKYLVKNKDVWLGATWWAAGPWWDNNSPYFASFEPPKGKAWVAYADMLAKYA